MLFIFSPFHLFTFKELGSYGVKPNAEVALAIFSPFHPFTFKGVSHFFIFSPFHLLTFKSLFTLKTFPTTSLSHRKIPIRPRHLAWLAGARSVLWPYLST